MNTLRCSICDKTNNMYVANISGWSGSSKRNFREDPRNPGLLICIKCDEEVKEALSDFPELDSK